MSACALSGRQMAVFAAIADTLVPPTGSAPGARELDLAGRLPEVVALLPSEARAELGRLLTLLDTTAGARLLAGARRPFTRLTGPERTAALRRMARSRNPLARKALRLLKTLVGALYGTAPLGERHWPVWDAMGYPGPDGPPPAVAKPLTPLAIHAPTVLTADVVVVGSGAGGGPAAAVLAEAGLDVVVLERGGYRNEADFTHHELEAYRDLYLGHAFDTTSNGEIGMLAGSTLGGGTVINYTTSFATPDVIRDQWDHQAGFDDVFSGSEYAAASDAVHVRLGVNRRFNDPPPRDLVMEKGLRDLGWHVDAMPRNVEGCTQEDCGYCTMGCRIGAKRSTLATWLLDAASAGARFVVDAHVDRVLTEHGRAVGVEGTVRGVPLVVRAPTVVLAAGALNTPAILLRSGIGGDAVGRRLFLHPVTAVWGRFTDPIRPWTGFLQTRYSDEFADLDGAGHGFKFETAPVHPMFAAAFFGWEDGPRYVRDVVDLSHWSPVGILLRDRHPGRVRLRPDGRPRWDHRLRGVDVDHLLVGIRRAAELLAAAGAVEVLASTTVPIRWAPTDDADVRSFADAVASRGITGHRNAYLSFHQMGTAPMGADPRRSVVDENNEVHTTPGCFVMDASTFPSSSGVNPMITIETIAHRAATRLAHRRT